MTKYITYCQCGYISQSHDKCTELIAQLENDGAEVEKSLMTQGLATIGLFIAKCPKCNETLKVSEIGKIINLEEPIKLKSPYENVPIYKLLEDYTEEECEARKQDMVVETKIYIRHPNKEIEKYLSNT